MLKYAIVVEHENDLPAYVNVDPGGHCHMSTSVINPPPDHFQYSSSELPAAMKALKRDYPTSFIVAHEVNFIDHEKMSDWWSRKRAQQLSAETTRACFSGECSTARAARQLERGNDGAMPFMVGNIVVLNSGSPPMTVKAITHAGQVLCQWIDSGGVLHEMEFAPEMLSDEPDTSRQ